MAELQIPRRSLTLAQSVMKRIGMVFNRINYGDPCPEFTEEMLRILGIGGFFAWAKHADGALKALSQRYGDTDAQLLTGMVAMWNGCTYCGKGHVLSANAHFFRETGRLFPLDEGMVYWLQRQRDSVILEQMRELLAADEHKQRLALIERLYLLKSGLATDSTPEDPYLNAVSGAWDWANECSITLKVIDVPPLGDGIGKDRDLMARYHEARKQWRAENADHPALADNHKPWQLEDN